MHTYIYWPHAHSILENPIVYTFRFCPGRGEAAAVHARVKRYGGCAPSALPRQGPPVARPTPRLEASFPSPCFAFPFQHAKQRRPGRRRHHRVVGKFIQTRQANTSKQQVRTNMQELDTISCR